MKHDRMLILSEARVKLHLAETLLHWTLSAEVEEIVSGKEIDEVRAKLKEWENRLFTRMRVTK